MTAVRGNVVILLNCPVPPRYGIEKDTLGIVNAAMGIGDGRLPIEWAPSAVFAVINTSAAGRRAPSPSTAAQESVLTTT